MKAYEKLEGPLFRGEKNNLLLLIISLFLTTRNKRAKGTELAGIISLCSGMVIFVNRIITFLALLFHTLKTCFCQSTCIASVHLMVLSSSQA